MRKNEESLKAPSLLSYLLIPSVAVGITVLLVLFISILVSSEAFSYQVAVYAMSGVVFVFCSFFSAIAARKFGKALVSALIFGLSYFLILYLLGMILFGRLLPASFSALPVVACASGSVLGGILSAAVKKRH